jgi:hypothetical protein
MAGTLLTGQETEADGNRMGIGVYAFQATGEDASAFSDPGWLVSLQIHFNRSSRHMGRLRIDYGRMDSADPMLTGTGLPPWDQTLREYGKIQRETFSVSYEWMPHLQDHSRSGLFGILGMGGSWWRDSWNTSAVSYLWEAHHDDDLAFQLTLGGGYRFNPHAALEARYTRSAFTTHASYPPRGERRDHLSCGVAFRF